VGVRAACLIVVCLLAGCYNFTPLATATPEPATPVAVTLTDEGSRELERTLGPEIFILRGRYLSSVENGLVLSVNAVETKLGDVHHWSGEEVTVPLADVATVDVRRLAKGRSILLASAGVAGVIASTMAFALTGGGTSQSQATRPPPR
jgi:hypothetical protein